MGGGWGPSQGDAHRPGSTPSALGGGLEPGRRLRAQCPAPLSSRPLTHATPGPQLWLAQGPSGKLDLKADNF